ncbi:MAG: helix-turn-helix transcriptional regulator [Oscillospiraceae bacterium]|nr:helix-turn-helix transcriptional regulator [Oscillospiraceae bacterium]
MSSTLFDYEWQFLLQMVTRINYCATYEETCETILQQMRTLIPFYSGIIFRTDRDNGVAVVGSPITSEPADSKSDESFFLEGDYPHWSEFIMAPYSTVFRQSDLIPPAKWEKTRVYRDIWNKKGIYWGLFISLVSKDCPLAIIGLMREKKDVDFSARDIYIMNAFKNPLERKFYSLLKEGPRQIGTGTTLPDKIIKVASRYGLTKRESEIVALVCASKSSEEMCEQLFITHATLSKHLSNIYAKTKVRNRTQLFGLFSDN